MKIISYKIKKIYINFLEIKPKIISTIIFIPILYLLGWILASPIFLTNLNKDKVSLIGTIFTFLIFIFSLPKWFRIRWGLNNTWKLLGINKINSNSEFLLYFLRGLFLASILISLILIPIVETNWRYWIGTISPEILINTILLIIGVGFAEELIFRGWLLEELKNQIGLKKAIIGQASIFSIVHIGSDLPFWEMLNIHVGLFFLGILLSLIRLKDKNSLWGCIGLHGGLVGFWFIANNGLLDSTSDYPKWLVGPGNINSNPLGGIFGISLMIIFCFLYLLSLKNNIKSLK